MKQSETLLSSSDFGWAFLARTRSVLHKHHRVPPHGMERMHSSAPTKRPSQFMPFGATETRATVESKRILRPVSPRVAPEPAALSYEMATDDDHTATILGRCFASFDSYHVYLFANACSITILIFC
mmetsp:Transcript_13756/g.38726  ORF Transcript_13756/g.38726 Transcript_13756/m.38726 type:complete len:126 (+) Transcript_13756:184-561(+)